MAINVDHDDIMPAIDIIRDLDRALTDLQAAGQGAFVDALKNAIVAAKAVIEAAVSSAYLEVAASDLAEAGTTIDSAKQLIDKFTPEESGGSSGGTSGSSTSGGTGGT